MKKKLTYVEPDAYFNESMKKILETGNTDETKKAKKGYPRETLFEFYQDYTYMDEDYYNEIIIESNGQLVVLQRSTYMYEPTTISNIRFMNEDFARDIKAVLEKNKEKIDELPNEDWSNDYCPYKIKIRDRKFELGFVDDDSTTAGILVGVRILIDYYYPKLINWENIFYEMGLIRFYDEVMEMAKKLDDSKTQ